MIGNRSRDFVNMGKVSEMGKMGRQQDKGRETGSRCNTYMHQSPQCSYYTLKTYT